MYSEFSEKYNLIKNQENIPNIEIRKDMDEIYFVKEIADKNPLVVFGCGRGCSIFFDWVKYIDIPIAAICDTYKVGENFHGYVVISLEEALRAYKNAYYFISTPNFYNEILEKLINSGVSDSRILKHPSPIMFSISPILSEYFEQTYLRGYQWTYEFFKDKLSKQIVLDRISMYLHQIPLKAYPMQPQYFDKNIIKLNEDEVFVDGGGYKGDSVLSFKKVMNKAKLNWKYIHSFEPDKDNFEIMAQNVAQIPNIKIIHKGLWSKMGKLQFINDIMSTSSHFADSYNNGGISATKEALKTIVPVISLDEYFSDYPETDWPTFIKMDIEGSEKEALIGAEKIIKTKHPKLVICAYHKPEDIYELTQLIYQYVPDYKFFLRQCENGYFETVLYAIIQE